MKHLWVLNRYFLKYRLHFCGGLLFVSLSTIFATYQGVVVREGTNHIISLVGTKGPVESLPFVRYGLLLIGLALTSGLFMFLMRQTIIVMSRHIEYEQKNEIYDHYQQLDAEFYKRFTTGDLMNRISEDVSKVRMYTGPAIMYIANTVVTTVTILIFMLQVNSRLTLFVFLPLPILSYIIYRVSNIIGRQSGKVQAELSALTAIAQESFSAVRVIKAYTRENHFSDRMKERNEAYRSKALRLASIESLFAPVMALMVGLSVLITVWYGGTLAIRGEIEPGNITEFIFYVFKLTWPFASLGWVTSLVQRAAASQERINEFLDRKPAIINPTNKTYPVNGSISFRNVSFTYPENQVTALRKISFDLPAGATLGITGQVGSGKSTIINLITRQYDPAEGEILIDDRPLRSHNLQLIRRNMGVVPQEAFLFSDTIANNIAFGARQATRSEVEDAAKKAQVYENISGFPNKFETMVGERGVTLSGGQKQRISIARAIIADPRIFLFDDCLSAVDTETEEKILKSLQAEMSGRTSVIVSHRVSSIKKADYILYLKDGEVAEQGTHEELMALRKNYYALSQLQEN